MDRDETLIAYLDGELTNGERAAFEAEIAADPALAAQVEQHRALAGLVARAYAPVLDEPVPARLRAMTSAANDPGSSRARWLPWAGMAACLAAGLLVGRMATPGEGPLASEGGRLVARGGLAVALNTKLAADSGPVKVGLTFRSRDGRYCRTFESAPDRLAGLACRDDGRWAARAVAAWTPAEQGAYRTAGSETPPAVLAAVDDAIAGQPLDAAGERAARDRDWKP